MNEKVETKNAIIQSADLDTGRGGMLTPSITFDYGGTCQGFGGYALYLDNSFNLHQLNTPAGHFIYRMMQVAGVEKWSDLPGRTVRVRSSFSKIHAIGHIVKDEWLCPEKDFSEARAENVERRHANILAIGKAEKAYRDALETALTALDAGRTIDPNSITHEAMRAAFAKGGAR